MDKSSRHMIVGVDTGKTIAFACLDLSGRLIHSDHKSSAGLEWLISAVENVGTPSVIACDKEPNDIIRKVGAAFNAKIYYPKKQLTILDKILVVKPFGIRNPHQRDACAAAVKAYNTYSNKLKQAEHIARVKNVREVDSIKAKIIEKYSIEEAISNKEANRK